VQRAQSTVVVDVFVTVVVVTVVELVGGGFVVVK
jgi:hypothetical protein